MNIKLNEKYQKGKENINQKGKEGNQKGKEGRGRNVVSPLRGISDLASAVIIFVISIVSIIIVLNIAGPTVDAGTLSIDLKNAEIIMASIDNSVMETVSEGFNSSRLISFNAPKTFETIQEEDAVQYKVSVDRSVSGIDYFTRRTKGNVIFVGGSDVRCAEEDGNGDNATDIVLENSFIKAVFKLVRRAAPHAAINTSDNILQLNEKLKGINITVVNSSVVIDDDLSTSTGTGFSELSINGTNLPQCQAHFFVNTTVDYDIYYKLYAGADFIVAEVRNIR